MKLSLLGVYSTYLETVPELFRLCMCCHFRQQKFGGVWPQGFRQMGDSTRSSARTEASQQKWGNLGSLAFGVLGIWDRVSLAVLE